MSDHAINQLAGELSSMQHESWQLRAQLEQLTQVMRDVLAELQRANELAAQAKAVAP